ncbi:MarR family winged helix-turn-helix transcriptional regulator [Clostridium saccharobutylicum]|uniref:Transcriptional regulator, marR family n=2 Tax=Clostridium saccharobutylicum TaxID=169679 RepID=U5MR89_CLOSA|nr:MarR family winged helix-turn-helix transcriptional regulator [Clostridium saccharobutylicum]AGX43018.1 transcriptional regulator, marR family [Clostridium saccharobutylicum DSM 13864]AQR90309.1 transcriptional regulator SlyA [Clostridium saccharobutylicum]AQS00215.1 transcriptional regulator SlyA [Clostridium saccharobutylicum]AQS10014.1 transcriptional regulator SlyA [Clostridium saccharobutylicum]AQS14198.1 transcriptional regulator SlyA [Clostridium saccharobutylicum]
MDRKVYDKKPSPCNCLNIRRASQALTEVYDEFISPSNLKLGQFSLLKHINQLGPVSVSDLASAIRLDRTTLVRNLKPLEQSGFIEDMSTEGTRNRQLKLTDKGIETYKYAEELWEKAQNFLEEYLGKDNIDVFTTLLSKIEALVP